MYTQCPHCGGILLNKVEQAVYDAVTAAGDAGIAGPRLVQIANAARRQHKHTGPRFLSTVLFTMNRKLRLQHKMVRSDRGRINSCYRLYTKLQGRRRENTDL